MKINPGNNKDKKICLKQSDFETYFKAKFKNSKTKDNISHEIKRKKEEDEDNAQNQSVKLDEGGSYFKCEDSNAEFQGT